MKCALCNGTGYITTFDMRLDERTQKLDTVSGGDRPCPFGCKASVDGAATGNTRIAGKEKRLAKGQLEKMARDPELVKEAKRLDKARKNVRKHVEGDYTITSYSIGIKDWYGLGKG